jgi:hypothetical protein
MLRGAAQKKRSQSFHTPSATTGDHARTHVNVHSARPRNRRAHNLVSAWHGCSKERAPSIIRLCRGLRATGTARGQVPAWLEAAAKRQPRHAPAGSPRAGVKPFLPKNFLDDLAPAPAFVSVCRESCESIKADQATFGDKIL